MAQQRKEQPGISFKSSGSEQTKGNSRQVACRTQQAPAESQHNRAAGAQQNHRGGGKESWLNGLDERATFGSLSTLKGNGISGSIGIQVNEQPPGGESATPESAAVFTVFYAWQSDSAPRDNRNFIETAIKKAFKKMNRDGRIDVSPRLDRDTKGISGIPDIAGTILQKIKSCDAFVADVSFIGHTNHVEPRMVLFKPTTEELRRVLNKEVRGGECKLLPNPNVMVELGYALCELGFQRIVLVLNTVTGSQNDLPFDLRNRRWPRLYRVDAATSPAGRKEAKEGLARQLQEELETIAKLGPRHKRSLIEQRVEALETVVSSMTGGFQHAAVTPNWLISPQQRSSAEQPRQRRCESQRNDLATRLSEKTFHNLQFQQGMLLICILSSYVPESTMVLDPKNETVLRRGLQPVGSTTWVGQWSGDAFMTISNTHGVVDAVTEMRADGSLNAAGHDAIAISDQFFALANQRRPAETLCIPSVAFEKNIAEAVFNFMGVLKNVGTHGPWCVGIGIINVKRSILYVDPAFSFVGRAFDGESLLPPLIEVNQNIELTNPQGIARLLRPAFDYIWREHGYPRSLNFGESGDWVGR